MRIPELILPTIIFHYDIILNIKEKTFLAEFHSEFSSKIYPNQYFKTNAIDIFCFLCDLKTLLGRGSIIFNFH